MRTPGISIIVEVVISGAVMLATSSIIRSRYYFTWSPVTMCFQVGAGDPYCHFISSIIGSCHSWSLDVTDHICMSLRSRISDRFTSLNPFICNFTKLSGCWILWLLSSLHLTVLEWIPQTLSILADKEVELSWYLTSLDPSWVGRRSKILRSTPSNLNSNRC